MIPTAFIRMDEFPLNANDKLDRAALPQPQFSASQYYVAAKTRLEKTLAAIWSEELGLKPIGMHDNFSNRWALTFSSEDYLKDKSPD